MSCDMYNGQCSNDSRYRSATPNRSSSGTPHAMAKSTTMRYCMSRLSSAANDSSGVIMYR